MKFPLLRLLLFVSLSLTLSAPLRADLYWGGGTSNVANGTALPTTTAGGNGTWNTALQNWALSQNGSSYGAWTNNQVANFGFYSNNATEAVTIAGNHTIGGLVFSNQPATASNLFLTLNASSAQTLTLAGSSSLFLITSSSATSGISIGNNITLGSGSATLTKDGTGRLVFGSSSGTANSNAFTGPLSVVSGLVLLDTASSMNGISTTSVSTYRSDISTTSATLVTGTVPYTSPVFQVNLANAAGTKLSDSLAVTLQRGEFNVQGGGVSSTETIGQIQLAPYGYLNTSSAIAGTTLTLGNGTVGIDRGTTGLGTMVIGANATTDALPVNVVLSNTTGLSKDSLLPWLTTSRAEFVQISSSNNTLTRIASTTADSNASNWASSYNATSNLRVTTTLSGALGSNLTVNSYGILGNGTTSLLEIGAGNTLTINSGAISMTGNGNRQYGFSNGTLTSGTDKLYLHTGVVNSSTLSINSSISGTLDIIKSGAVGASLSGTVANTYTGNLIVNSGDLDLAKSGAVTGAAFVRGGALLSISNATALSATSNVTVDKKGVLVLSASANLSGAITLNGGQILQTNSDPTFSGSGFGLQFNGGLYTFSNGNTTKTAKLLTNVSYAESSTESAVIRNISTGTANLTIQLNTGASAGNAERVFQINDSLSLAADAAEMVVEVAIANGGSGTTTGSLRKTGNGTLQFLAPMTYSGGTVIDAGTLQLSTVSRDAKTGLTGTTSSLTPKTLTFVEPVASTFIVGQTLNGTNIAAGAKIIDILNDYQVVMSASASATGSAANIASGNLSLTGRLAGNVTINSGGTLLVDGNTTFSSGSSIAINSGGFLRLGANGTAGSIGTNSSLSNNGTIVFQRSNTLTQGTDFGSGISGNGTLLQAGSGTTILAGTNSFNGTVSVQSGSLVLSGANAVGSSASLVIGNIAGATLSVNASQTAGTLSGGGAVGGSVVLASGQTLTLASSSNSTFDGQIQGAGNLAKAGSGTLTLAGANTNNGTISISAGTLLFQGNNSLSTSVASLNASTANATLSLADGTTRNSTISGSLNLNASAFRFDLDGTTADFLSVGGNASLTGAGKIQLNLIAAPSSGAQRTWDLITANGTGGLTSNWVLDDQSFAAGDFTWSLSTVSNNTTLRLSADPLQSSLWWSGNQSSLWTNAANWSTNSAGSVASGSAPSSTIDVIFSATVAGNRSTSLGADTSIKSLRIDDSNDVSIAAGNTLTLTGSGAGVITIAATSGTTTINATLSGSQAGLTKSGLGTLVLNAANSYSGATTLTAGTLQVANLADGGVASSIGNSSSSASNLVLGTATFVYTGSNTTSNRNFTLSDNASTTLRVDNASSRLTLTGNSAATTGALVIQGPGTLALSGSNLHSGGTTLANGTLQLNSSSALGSGLFTIQGGTIDNTSGAPMVLANSQSWAGDFTFTGSSNLTTADVSLSGNRTVTTASGTLSVNGSVTGGGLTKSGAGTLVLAGNNSYSGSTSVTAGTLRLQGGVAIPDAGALILSNSAGVAVSIQNSETIGSLQGGGLSGGSVSIAANATLTVAETGNQTFAGTISGAGNFTKSGAGTLTLANTMNATGGILISGGTLATGAANIFSSSASITANSSTLRLGGNQSISAFTGSTNRLDLSTYALTINGSTNSVIGGSITGTNGTLIKDGADNLAIYSSANTFSGQTILNAGSITVLNTGTHFGTSTVTINNGTLTANGGNFNVSAGTITAVLAGSNGLVKSGNGTVALSASNSYSGATTVNSGTLQAAATGALANSTVINVDGGSFLVTAENAVNDNADINLGGGRIAVSGNFEENVGALTLSADSIIDLNGFSGILRFSGLSWASGASNATLAIWNWSGTTEWGTKVNDWQNPSQVVFADNANLTAENLAKISFYSGGNNSGFIGNAFSQSFNESGFEGHQIIAVPETETYFSAVALLSGLVFQYLRRRAKRKPLEGHRPA